MTNKQKRLDPDPKMLLSQLTVEQFSTALEKSFLRSRRQCSDFSSITVGPISGGNQIVPIDIGQINVTIWLKSGGVDIVKETPPGGTEEELYLRVVGSASILVQFPIASRLDLGFWHIGDSGDIQVDVLDHQLKSQFSHSYNKGWHNVACESIHLRFARLDFISNECLISRICYLPEQR